MWVHPAAWTGPTEAVADEWASTWGSARILVTLAETYARTKDPAVLQEARETLLRAAPHCPLGRPSRVSIPADRRRGVTGNG